MAAFNRRCNTNTKVQVRIYPIADQLFLPFQPCGFNVRCSCFRMSAKLYKMQNILSLCCSIHKRGPILKKFGPHLMDNVSSCLSKLVLWKVLSAICKNIHIYMPCAKQMNRFWEDTIQSLHKSCFSVSYYENWGRYTHFLLKLLKTLHRPLI